MGNPIHQYSREMLAGFRAAAKEFGLDQDPGLILDLPKWAGSSGRPFLESLARIDPKPTALFASETRFAIDMWRVLAVLSYRGAQRQVDLVGMTSIEASTVSRLVTRLVRLGLVTRRRSQTSNREVVIELTAKGRAQVDRIIPSAKTLEQIAAAGVSSKDMAVVKRALRRMFENMAQQRR